jgi:hypothetical protein
MKKLLAVMLMCGLVFLFAGCKKNEAKAQMPPGHPGMEGSTPPAMHDMPKKERAVVVPEEVKAKWKAVKLVIEDKAAKTSKEYTVAVGTELAVPNTKLIVKVLAYLPDLRVGENDITSASNKPNNPAAQVVVREVGKKEWNGWLYAKLPEIHAFPHENIGMRLVGGVSK